MPMTTCCDISRIEGGELPVCRLSLTDGLYESEEGRQTSDANFHRLPEAPTGVTVKWLQKQET